MGKEGYMRSACIVAALRACMATDLLAESLVLELWARIGIDCFVVEIDCQRGSGHPGLG